jgi:tetratricopeptide (TPR) repeat protein
VLAGLSLSIAALTGFAGCNGWDPRSPFERNAPEVDEALVDLDAGRQQNAEQTLEQYLGTGRCSVDGGIGLPASLVQKPNGSFDLGLTLFYLGEGFGQRFGDEELAADGGYREEQNAQRRAIPVGCALAIARAIANDPKVPLEVRARAHYLAGNLEFLRRKYEEAVKEYDQALALVPGLMIEAGGDGIGRDAAWNRAIALRRIQDQKDAGSDAPDASDGDDGSDGSDASDGSDGRDGSNGDDGGDGGDKGDAGKDAGGDGGDKQDQQDAGGDDQQDGGAQPEPQPPQPAKPESTPEQDRRMLEQLEQAPTYQEQEAKQRARVRGRARMEDK